MNNIISNVENFLQELGDRLKRERLARNVTQEVFAARIGLTRQTYSKMEKGSSTIPIGYWLEASNILGLLDTWQDVLSQKENLFAQYEQRKFGRQRASGKKRESK